MGSVIKFGFHNNIVNVSNHYRNTFNNKTGPEIAITKNYQLPTVFVEMDDFIHYGPNNISIFPNQQNIIAFTEKKFYLPSLNKENKGIVRNQIPLDIAFARTVHSSQGVTAKEDIVYFVPHKSFCEFLSYVALSRAGSLKQIHLLNNYLTKKHFEIHEKTKNEIEQEYLRLKNLLPMERIPL